MNILTNHFNEVLNERVKEIDNSLDFLANILAPDFLLFVIALSLSFFGLIALFA